MTSGKAPGTSSLFNGQVFRAYVAIAALISLIDCANVATLVHDAARQGQALATWKPIALEATSGLGQLAACGVIYIALRYAPPGRARWGLALVAHGLASLVFSVLHLGGMVLLRSGIAAIMGLHYQMAVADFPFEYRKDILAYLAFGGVFWVFTKSATEPQIGLSSPAPPSTTFDIAVGTRTLRLQVGDIILLRGAGNYVEFLLADGRKPLVRASLREMEVALQPSGFIRTHRSWMVNARHVNGFRPAGSGDFQVELEGGVEAPLSRRFPQALARLRTCASPLAD